MLYNRVSSLLFLAGLSTAQTQTGTLTITPSDVAYISSNLTALELESPFQVYDSSFLPILGSSASLTQVYNASFPAFHEAGVVTSLDPLTLYSSSNQFNTTSASPDTNNKTIVVSRTVQNTTTGEWTSTVIQNNTFPLILANGGFQYEDGILFLAQGSKNTSQPAALVYLDTRTDTATTILDNYLGVPLNSPNDVYVTLNGVIYFTDPQIGYVQSIRPTPSLQNQVYGFVPNTTKIRIVADQFGAPNGITFSPDEKTAYITDTGVVLTTGSLPGTRTIYAYDVVYANSTPAQGEIASFVNRRTFALPAVGLPDGIKCDTNGNVWVGCGDGLNVFSPDGLLLGKVIVKGGVANFGFGGDGKLLVMAEKLLYLLQVDAAVQPAVPVGQPRS